MKKMRFWKKAAVLAVALAFVLSACGAGSAGSAREESYAETESAPSAGFKEASNGAFASAENYAAEEAYDSSWDGDEEVMDIDEGVAPMMASAVSGNGSGSAAPEGSGEGATQADLKSPNRKIVYTGNVSLQTLEYDKSSQSIHDRIRQCGGFIESEDTYNEDPYWYYSDRSGSSAKRTRRNLSITARIPADKFDAFMKDLENDGQVTNTSVNAQNISVSYATHDASRKALEIEKDRLLKMMDKAETVEEMIQVEERLTQVERELGDEMTQLSAMDRDLDFSTVYISLQEVFEYSEQVVEVTYGEKLQKAFGRAIDGFVNFWQELLLFVVETFPFLIMLAVVIVLLRRFLRRRKARKMEERARLEAIRRQAAAQAGGGMAGEAAPDGTSFFDRTAGKRGLFGFGRKKKNPETGWAPGEISPAAPAETAAAGTAPGTPPETPAVTADELRKGAEEPSEGSADPGEE